MGDDGNGVVSWLTGQPNIINNIAANLIPVQNLVTGAAYLIGLAFAFKALYSLKIYGETRMGMTAGSHTMREPLMYLFVSAIFIFFPTAVDVFLNTTFGSSNILQYAPINSSNNAIDTLFGSGSMVGQALAIIMQTIGLIAFIRGWVLIARGTSQGQGSGTGKGLVHVFGGILAINIVATLELINNTLYGT